mmetsp:Transcript_61527/g.127144  ORF Transcript_61527/g.127144 Transcript_61527/m.127144 type:complete len:231 (-) Transcript_61527:1617-2309(-)
MPHTSLVTVPSLGLIRPPFGHHRLLRQLQELHLIGLPPIQPAHRLDHASRTLESQIPQLLLAHRQARPTIRVGAGRAEHVGGCLRLAYATLRHPTTVRHLANSPPHCSEPLLWHPCGRQAPPQTLRAEGLHPPRPCPPTLEHVSARLHSRAPPHPPPPSPHSLQHLPPSRTHTPSCHTDTAATCGSPRQGDGMPPSLHPPPPRLRSLPRPPGAIPPLIDVEVWRWERTRG